MQTEKKKHFRCRKKIRKSREDKIMDTVIAVLGILILFLTVYPFYYVVVVSLNDGIDALKGGIYWWPRVFSLENYSDFFSDMKWVRAMLLTVVRTIAGTALGVGFTMLVSYAASFKDLIGRKWYMLYIIVCMYFSGGVIPYYVVLRTLHLVNTFWVYVIPGMLNLFYVMIGRGFFEGIPSALRESAKIDGASEWKIFTSIICPISKPFIATMALFIGVAHWNNWYDSTFFVRTPELRTLPYLVMQVIHETNVSSSNVMTVAQQAGGGVTNVSVQLAAVVISVVPIVLVYPFLQKYFVSGMVVGAVKE